jgi:hypothetical protein
MRRLANVVTLCDGHGVFFVAASGQLLVEPTRDEPALNWERLRLGAQFRCAPKPEGV